MKNGILGKKLGMTQIFADDGRRIPVTVVEAGPCVVIQKKTVEKDGYSAIQVGFSSGEAAKASKPLVGHCKSAGKGVFTHLREFRVEDVDQYNIGDQLGVDQFQAGDFVDITGTSIGKGFQGVIKRWGFKGGRSSHGSRFHRAPGSIGCSATPSRVFKNKKMPGQLGNVRTTIQRLQVVRVDSSENILLIKGAVPGATNGLVILKPSIKA
ncbi:50S ribosomal protein L3 [Geobacter pelophilus]|jgi:large subunit ribosomal protein L3|uniref:Large ribosomal subunit protein uL3 n=1 Tax=Geoanaerobacter pelophilus TaxID=60036 RepID=A0AAW4LC17_9BACT|nr:50S ribosomal protein L3 [Geoanaerobacter pelophilus]MBT0666638.1 50S ribosomal protein L3 [Geoanaerobacter pelophilus]